MPQGNSEDEEFWKLQTKLLEHQIVINTDRSVMLFDDAFAGNLRAIVHLCAGYVTKVEVMSDACRDRHIELLKQLPLLTHLKLQTCKRLTDESLLHVSKMSSLETLELDGLYAEAVTAAGLMQLSRLKNIELIRLPRYLGSNSGLLGMREVDAIKVKLRRELPNAVIN